MKGNVLTVKGKLFTVKGNVLTVKDNVLTVQFDDHGEGHDEDGHEEVGDGERHEEEVGHVLKSSLPAHGQTDEHIAQDAGHDDQGECESAPP